MKRISNTIKKKTLACILGFTLAVALTGCSVLPSLSDDYAEIDRDAEYIPVGTRLTAPNTDSRLTLLNNMNTLSSDGLYYASWTAGDAEAYENSDGETVDLYDAQLYLLLGEAKTAETAEKTAADWLAAGQVNYDVTAEESVVCNGQTYTLITYRFTNAENPYERGISAFGVFENCAVCAELTCQETYDEDLREMLVGFLDECSYK